MEKKRKCKMTRADNERTNNDATLLKNTRVLHMSSKRISKKLEENYADKNEALYKNSM